MRHGMLVVMAVLVCLAGTARGQGLRLAAPLGPPAPQQLEDQRQLSQQQRNEDLIRFVADQGLPVGGAFDKPQVGAEGASNHDVAIPDVTQTIPTTSEPKKLSASLQILLLLSVLTLAPSILLMTTCFTRVVIVMSLLRQALGAAQLPPNQILIGLSLFMTFLVMGPTWTRKQGSDCAVHKRQPGRANHTGGGVYTGDQYRADVHDHAGDGGAQRG